jgi:protein TonB
MFSTLETSWDRSARRGWSTFASFIFQGLALSLLLAVPLFWMEGPPLLRLADILQPPPPAPAPAVVERPRPVATSSNLSHGHVIEPPSVPPTIAILHESQVPAVPDIGVGVPGGTELSGRRVSNTIADAMNVVVPPPTPIATHPIRISHMAEGSLIYRVQPEYPEIARQARIQGAVQLRAIISKTGTIENLIVESGHPILISAALKAVRQWRYRPYMLNGEPVEVDTEITVNFILGG